jgi:uncharacterized YigZ family protein
VNDRYPVPAGRVRVEEDYKKSRFITTLAPVSNSDEANALRSEVRAELADASHHCWAFLVGPPGSTTNVGMSDDGEPHNTAGRPMLNVLVHCGMGDVAAVVTRYWGGTKLGKGGLVRAYSGGVQRAISACGIAEKVNWVTLDVAIDYASVTGVKRLCPDFEATVLSETFGEKALFRLQLPSDSRNGIRAALTELTNGQVTFP